MKKILVPTDGSECSTLALDKAVELARKFDGEIILVHVNEPIADPQFLVGANFTGVSASGAGSGSTGAVAVNRKMPHEDYMVNSAEPKPVPDQEKLGDFILGNAVERCLKENIRHSVVNLVGRPADAIVEYAEQENVDLIVMGSHGMGGFRRFFFGSVTHKVALSTHKSILIVR